jgi:DNA-binding XRE family transcriptional regulator
MRQTVSIPLGKKYVANPATLGEKIRNRRLELRLTQEEAGRRMGVTRLCVVDWENNNSEPAIEFYPVIVGFLGYLPFSIEDSTLAGKVKKYRFQHGLSQAIFGKLVNAGGATIYRLENNIGVPNRRLLERVEELINNN